MYIFIAFISGCILGTALIVGFIKNVGGDNDFDKDFK